MGLRARLVGFLRAQDGGVCALFGGYWWESISGTAGRAAEAGKWWGKPLAFAIDHLPLSRVGHCARQAEEEARVRAVILGGESPL